MPLIIRGNVLQSRGRVDWLPDANAAQPAMTFVSDPDTGIYHPGENQLALATGGADRLVVHDLGTTITGNVTATGGSFVGNGQYLEHIQVDNIDGLDIALEDLTNNSVTTNVIYVSEEVIAGGFVGNGQYLEHIQLENIDGLSTALDDLTNNTVTTNVLTTGELVASHQTEQGNAHKTWTQAWVSNSTAGDKYWKIASIPKTQNQMGMVLDFDLQRVDGVESGVFRVIRGGATIIPLSELYGREVNTAETGRILMYDNTAEDTFDLYVYIRSFSDVRFSMRYRNYWTVYNPSTLVNPPEFTTTPPSGTLLHSTDSDWTINKLKNDVKINGSVTANVFLGDGSQLTGISQPMALISVQITDASFVPIDDTALLSNVGGYFLVNGINFAPGSIAIVGGTNASATAYHSSTQLRVHAPPKSSGSYTVSVVRSGDGSSASLPSGVTYSEGITWITDSQLGNVDEGIAFSIPIQATSDSQVTYSNVGSLPPSTTLNPTTGALAGTISGVIDTTYAFDIKASDLEYQDAVRSFILRCLGLRVVRITGFNHTLALSNRGRLAGWGINSDGQTGVGNTTSPVTLPVDITDKGSLAGRVITDIACSMYHSAALTSDGMVTCWGYNIYAQCGQGNTTTPQLTPVLVGGLLSGKTVTAISCGGNHTLALTNTGIVYAWGYNADGQIGNGGTIDAVTPFAVTSGSLSGKTVTKIAAGGAFSMAICSDGTLHMWGRRAESQIPGGESGSQTTPTEVGGHGALVGKEVVDIQCGIFHCLVLCSDNSVISWGYNDKGQVGIGNTTPSQNTPQNITNNGSLSGRTVTQILLGQDYSSIAIASDGSIHAWGNGIYGEIGDGAATNRTLPVNISSFLGGQPISRITVGGYTRFAIRDDTGTVSAWGWNAYYQLGDGTTTQRNSPVDVTTNIMAVLDP